MGVSREEGNIIDGEHIGFVFPDALLTTSKLRIIAATYHESVRLRLVRPTCGDMQPIGKVKGQKPVVLLPTVGLPVLQGEWRGGWILIGYINIYTYIHSPTPLQAPVGSGQIIP